MSLFPKHVVEKIQELGFHTINVVELKKVWSVIGLKDEQKFNVLLDKTDLSVEAIYLLRYKLNQWGSKIADVDRILIQHKNAKKMSGN